MRQTAWLVASVLLAVPALASPDDEEPAEVSQGAGAADPSETLRRVQESLSDPAAADAVARRIARSRLADRITDETDPERRLAAIKAWIASDPATATGIAVGLAQDDASGSRVFEDAMTRSTRSKLVLNPEARKGIYGRLKKQGHDSGLLKRQMDDLAGEEQREILRTLFEGKGAESNKIITQEERPGDAGQAGPVGAKDLRSSFYDRLGAGNLRGYSPQLQALQSALNQHRVPGASKLIETGRLDYETLSYPGYGMRWDIARLERGLRYERNLALALTLGFQGRYTAEQLLEAEVEARLLAQAAGREPALSPRFKRRQAALQRAAQAAQAFDTAAARSRDPKRIDRALLVLLGDKQREAARWITVAALEEELARLDADERFLTPELRAAIDAAPVDAGSRQAYLKRGEEFSERLRALKANDEKAVAALESGAWQAGLAATERLLLSNGPLRKDLGRNIRDYSLTPFRLIEAADRRSRWRRAIDELVLAYAPRLAYSRRLLAARRERDALKDVFVKIAMGSLDAAHAALASFEAR